MSSARQSRGRRPETGLRNLDVRHGYLAGAAIFLGVKRDLLPLGERAKPSAFKSGDVNEYVLPAIVRLDETVAFLRIEEFHGSLLHGYSFQAFCRYGSGPTRLSAGKLLVSMFGEESERTPTAAPRWNGPIVRPKSMAASIEVLRHVGKGGRENAYTRRALGYCIHKQWFSGDDTNALWPAAMKALRNHAPGIICSE
jgi:hypothetical protein